MNTRLFLQIVLPLSGAIIAVIGLYVAVANWNSYFNALIYLMKEDKKPLQIVLRNILIKNEETVGGGWSDIVRRTEMIKYAIILVATVPIMCAYPLIQKYFTKGVMLGSLKG
jgi:putative aldouronate transport system permease protein